MRKRNRMIQHMGFIIAVAAVFLGISGIAGSAYAEVNDKSDGIYFAEPYTSAGESLTVTYDGSEGDVTYKWFADEDLLECGDDTLSVISDYYEKTIRAEVWSGDNKLGYASMFCSKLPVVYLDTEGGAEVVTKDYYINADMRIQGNDLYSSSGKLYTGATEIKGRGNSTWKMFPKKPYRLKLAKKADLFGMGKSKHWVLLANYIDESCMRNMLAGEMARKMDVGAMEGTWVELVMNGKSQGVYMLCEHVRLDEDRVDVFDWESAAEDIAESIAEADGYTEDEMDDLTDLMAEDDMSWISTGEVVFNGKTYKTADYYEDLPESFSGGYLLELDLGYDEVSRFTTDNGAPLMFKSPEFICTDPIAMDTVKNYVQTFEDALYSKDFNTAEGDRMISYTELCDMDSLTGYWLASEMMINEMGYKSTYFHKDIDQPLVFGPVWDFDYSSASVTPFGSHDSTDWTSDNKVKDTKGDKWWFDKVIYDPYFAVKAREEFIGQEEFFRSIIADGGLMTQWNDYLKEAGQHNYDLWQYARGYNADYSTLKSWLTERIYWMDEQFATNESAIRSLGITLSDKFDVSINGQKALTAEVGGQDLDLSVKVNEGTFTELNYYINSKYQGTTAIKDGRADIIVREEQLTEDVGKDNVITVWLKDEKGQLAEQQYMTVKLISDKPVYNVVFSDMGGTHAEKAAAGEKVYIDEPPQQDEMTAFEGWSDGNESYEVGRWITVNGDITFTAVWATCSDGGYTHDFAEKDGISTCIRDNCTVTKESDKAYKKITSCTLTCSNRYDNYYTGKEIRPEITVSDGDKLLTEGKDYTLEYGNTVDAGFGLYTIRGIEEAGYSGEVMLSYRIIARNISKAKLTVPVNGVLKNGAAKPAVSLTYNGTKLVEGKDYTLEYAGNTSVGTGSVTVSGKGNFTGSVTKNFNVLSSARQISKCTFTSIGTKAYTGKAIKPAVTVKDGGKKLTAGVDYKVTYSNNVKCGTASVKITAVSGNGCTGSKTIKFNIRPAKVTPKVTNVKYNQQKITWGKVTGATAYKVYRSTNNKTFKLMKTVKASAARTYASKGLVTGKTYYYKVRAVRVSNGTTYWGIKSPAVKLKTALSKGKITYAKNTAKGTVTIRWNSVSGAQGYKIYRSTTGKNGSFKLVKTAKLVTQYKNTNLKKGKTYYYKVRPYRMVNGKTVYGEISLPVKVVITK